jgi:hypothetical protein
VKLFAQFAAFPNPLRGALVVRYLMPEGVSRVDISLYSLAGRRVWSTVQRNIRVGAPNRIVWNGTVKGRPVAAGSYILRLSAFGDNGQQLKSINRELIRLP